MKIARFKKNNLLLLFFTALVLAGVISLIVNRGFYYTELKPQSIVTLTNTENESTTFEKLEQFKNIARIDRDQNRVILQNINRANLEEQIAELELEDSVEVTYSQPAFNQRSLLNNILLASGLLYVTTYLGILYVVFRQKQNFLYPKYLIKLALSFGLMLISAVVIQTSLLSLLSILYQLRELDTYSIFISAIFVALIFSLVITKGRTTTDSLALNNLLVNIQNFAHSNIKFTWVIALVLIPTWFGLGINFVIPSIILTSALLISTLSLMVSSRLLLRFTSRANQTTKQAKSKEATKADSKKAKSLKSRFQWRTRAVSKRKKRR